MAQGIFSLLLSYEFPKLNQHNQRDKHSSKTIIYFFEKLQLIL